MASGQSSKKSRPVIAPVVRHRQGPPWLTIAAVAVVLALVAAIFAFVYSKQSAKNDAAAKDAADTAALSAWQPTATNNDPSRKIPGIYIGKSVSADGTISYPDYKAALHVTAAQRVAYDRYPPVGGPHDATWAACNGVVYPKAVRDENMVHTLEHGAIWITYNPTKIAAGDLNVLQALVVGKQFITLTPYPKLDQPISLQSWGHQLKVQSASDARVKEFITALKQNQYTFPESGSTCDQPTFDSANPPAFDPSPRGADAIPLNGAGLSTATGEMTSGAGGAAADTGPATAGGASAAVSTASAGTTSASSK